MYKNSEGKDDEGRMVKTTGKNQKRLHIGVHVWDVKKKNGQGHLSGDGRERQKGSG